MARITAKFGDIPSNDVPDGEYDAMITRVEHRAKDPNDPGYLNWEFQIASGEHTGRKVFLTTSLKPQALWNLRDQFQALGIPADTDLEIEIDEESKDMIEPDVVSTAVVISIVNEEYNGRQIPKVGAILRAYESPAKSKKGKSLL